MFQKGDLLLKVNDASLDGLTHSQAVATLKATISLCTVSLTIMEVIRVARKEGNQTINFFYFRAQKQVLELRILYQVGCSGRNFHDSCSILRQSFSTGKTGPVGASPLLVINTIKIDNCIWGYTPSPAEQPVSPPQH